MTPVQATERIRYHCPFVPQRRLARFIAKSSRTTLPKKFASEAVKAGDNEATIYSRIRRYDNRHGPREFRRGDRVYVMENGKRYEGGPLFRDVWVAEMDVCIGTEGRVMEVHCKYGVLFRVKSGYWWFFPPQVLALIQPGVHL